MGTRIRFTRSGGLAGLEMVASVDVDDVPVGTATRLRSALGALEKSRATGGPAEAQPGDSRAQGADRYQYDLVVEDAGKRRSVTAHDGNMTPELQALVDMLLPFARPQ